MQKKTSPVSDSLTFFSFPLLPVTKYAESAENAQSQTHRWCPVNVISNLNFFSVFQILIVLSAEHVARSLNTKSISPPLYSFYFPWLTLYLGSGHIVECNRCGPAIWRVVPRWRVPMYYSTFSIHNRIPFHRKWLLVQKRETWLFLPCCWLPPTWTHRKQYSLIAKAHLLQVPIQQQRWDSFWFCGGRGDAYQLMSARMGR
jgi:hypothetical protein